MYEHKTERLLPMSEFLQRMARSIGFCAIVVVISLAIGIAGYHFLCDLPWVDALLNSSMILTGMGPVDAMRTTSAKLFASAYALYSGVAFLTIMATLIAPLAHRLMHKFHLEEESDSDNS